MGKRKKVPTVNHNKTLEKKQNEDIACIVDKERIQKWKHKKAKSKLSFAFKQKNKNSNKVVADFDEKNLSKPQQCDIHNATTCAATGTASYDYSLLLLNQTIGAFFPENLKSSSCATAIIEALLALEPKDEIEGMLITRLLALHSQYMHFMSRVSNLEQTTAGVDMNINRATKLIRLYNETLEALNRHRRKGQQKITVQHVHVSEGGKAIIGNVAGGGDNAKN